jgi:hypothetical protein
MLYNFGFLTLWRPLLVDLCARLAHGNETMTQDDAQFALACVKLASTSFSRSEETLQYGAVSPNSWPVMYTLFQSVLYLLALLSLDDVATQLDQIWRPAVSGLQLLAACRCADGCAAPALNVLKVCSGSGLAMHYYVCSWNYRLTTELDIRPLHHGEPRHRYQRNRSLCPPDLRRPA